MGQSKLGLLASAALMSIRVSRWGIISIACCSVGAAILLFPQNARSATIAAHAGDTSPTTENFGLWPFNGSISVAALPHDHGHAAWQIANSGSTNEQAYYNLLGGTGGYDSGGSGLTAPQIKSINKHGFTVSLRARLVQGPIYISGGTNLFSIGATVAGFNDMRYDIDLGSDGNGNTLVILPTLTSFNNVVFTATPFGAPLLIEGTGYHLYQLSFDPTTQLATLYVDGAEQVVGYPGSSVSGGATANNYGLAFGSVNDATGNFALVKLVSGQLKASEGTDAPISHDFAVGTVGPGN